MEAKQTQAPGSAEYVLHLYVAGAAPARVRKQPSPLGPVLDQCRVRALLPAAQDPSRYD